MALNDFQKDEARRLFAEGRSVSDVYKHLGAKSAGFKSPLEFSAPASPLAQKPGFAERTAETLDLVGRTVADLPQDVTSLGRGVQDVTRKLGTNLSEAVTTPGLSLTQRGAGLISAPVSFGTGLVGEGVVGAARFAATPETEQAATEFIGKKAEEVMQTDTVKGATDWYNSLDEQNKYTVSRLFAPALDLVSTAAPVGLFKGMFGKAAKSTGLPDVTPKIQEAFTKAETGDVSDATRIANATLDETTRATEVDNLAKAYQDSLVGDRTKVNRLLQEQAADMTRGDVTVTQDDLIKSLANEGIIPDVRGKLADFTNELRNLEKRQNELFKAYEPILNSSKATASLDEIAKLANESIIDSPTIRFDVTGTQNKLNDIIENLRIKNRLDADGKLTAKQIDQISRDANAESKAFRDSGNKFEADVYSELGRVARQWLNENIPDDSFRKVNDEWLRLEQVKRTAEAMQNQQVDVGILGRALGSYVTTLTGVTLGASVGNPFMAVAAGILTKMGGDQIADALRSTRFSPEIRAKLQERLTSDKELIEKLKETATTQDNKNLFEELSRRLPAAGKSGYRSEVGSGAPIIASQTGASAPKGNIVETVKQDAIKQPSGDGKQTLVKDIQDVETDVIEQMRASIEMSEVTTSATPDGKYLRNSSFPNWLPDDKELRSKELMTQVLNHLEEGTVPKEFASNQFKLYEVMKQHMERVKFDKFAAKNNWGMTADDIPFAILLTTGVLGAYYSMGEDGGLIALPVMGFMAATPGGKKLMIKELERSIKQMEKVAGSTKDKPTLNRLQNGIDSAKQEIKNLEKAS